MKNTEAREKVVKLINKVLLELKFNSDVEKFTAGETFTVVAHVFLVILRELNRQIPEGTTTEGLESSIKSFIMDIYKVLDEKNDK